VGDELGIVELIKQELNPESDLNVWKWKYKENPTHAFPNTCVAEDKGTIIAHYAINPVVMKCKDNYILGSQSSEIATRSNYRRQGLFKALSCKVADEAGEKGIPITYVFPNYKSYPGFIKMGWTHIFSFIVLAKVLNAKTVSMKYSNNVAISKIVEIAFKIHELAFKFKSSPNTEDIIISNINSFDDSFSDLWVNVSRYYDYIIKRDPKYLNWRYSHPRETFKIYAAKKDRCVIGYVILKCKILPDIRVGYIYDLFCDPNDDTLVECLISKSIKYFIEKRMDLAQICVLKNHSYHRICRKYGFLNRSKKPFLLHINSQEYNKTAEDFKDYKKWFVSFGDLYYD